MGLVGHSFGGAGEPRRRGALEPPEQWEEWLADTACAQLLRPAGRNRRGRFKE
jgi:hypothetical protein